MARRHPCERGLRCSCHRAGPSTLPTKKTLLAAAALVCPVLAAPTATRSPTYLNPTLEKRVTDAGQAPDDPSEGFTHQHIQLADLIRAGLPYKYVYDPKASADHQIEEIEVETNGAWVIDDSWSLHGRRFGPLSATATAGITDDPLPTPTESIPPASTPTPITTTSTPTILAIQSSLPTGWDSTHYARSGVYAIPLVVSFSLVIALMIGSLIGAMVIRRDRSRSRRRKKRITEQGDDDDSTREKVMQSSLVSRVGRALKHRDDPPEEEVRSELEHRVKNWARRSSAWRAQARIGVRRRMGRGRKRPQADSSALSGAIQEEPEPEDEPRNTTRASSPVRSRAPTPILTVTENQTEPPSAAPNYSSPVVPTYSSPPAAGPSTPSPIARLEAHPDATPSDEPAYDGPGSGQGLPPAYRGGGMSEIARGKRPAHVSSESVHQVPEERRDERRVWTELDAYAFGQGGNQVVTAHVATDDKRVLEQLHSMRGAPEEEGQGGEHDVRAPREEDVFGTSPSTSSPSSTPSEVVSSGAGALPLPPTKTGTGPVARYGEADLCLPGYLDGGSEGMGVLGKEGLVPSAPEDMEMVPSSPGDMDMGAGMVPSAPPCEEVIALPSAPPALEDDEGPSVSLGPSAPPFPLDDTNDTAHPTPSAPDPDDTLPTPQTPHLRNASSTCPLLSEDR